MEKIIGTVLFVLLFILFEIFWIYTLISCIRLRKKGKMRRLLYLLIFNVFAVIPYWYFAVDTQRIPQEDFERRLNAWLNERGLSLAGGEKNLSAMVGFLKYLILPTIVVFIIGALGRYIRIELPLLISAIVGIGIAALIVLFIVFLVKQASKSRSVNIFLVKPILQARAGNRGDEIAITEFDQYPTNRSTTLYLGLCVLFFFVFVLCSFTLLASIFSMDNPKDGIMGIGASLAFFSMGIMVNLRFLPILFLHKSPQLIHKLFRHYTLLNNLLYIFPILFFTSFLCLLLLSLL